MNLDSLAKIDLNLLVTLQILLEENSVTRAANRLNLSQSAISKSLNRLREILDDPLFQRTAHGLRPTAHALQLKEKLPQILQSLYQLTQPASFVMSQSQRHFSFATQETIYETSLPRFIGPLLSNAPNIRLHAYVWNEHSMQDLVQGQLDFAIAGRDIQPLSDVQISRLPEGIHHQTLFNDHQVCLVRKGHPILKVVEQGGWNLEQYLQLAHVQARCENRNWWSLDYFLAESGHNRQLSTIVPDFYSAISVCAHTDLIFTVPSKFAQQTKKLYPVVELPLPMEFCSFAYVLLWHQRDHEDPGHQWIRQVICDSIGEG
ncbi:LysR family transcriptional regulator [Shewanella gelidii]|uniref:LysR family transcriptional regulator n=1 Tax=Shewanella gelidii TaxID=1642821 RepID=A0A917NAN5_9GAMM|nr:LysR family transcriptional regulator [Shewanella gelidii]MCL1098514.1 LysR family transcriptional regulator [Shewanella gelidii]GGI82160.1 LysR family transcriptional regulator [Shewanella gelidii]